MELPIEKILDSYRLETPEKTVRKAAQQSIEAVADLTFSLSDITYQKGTLWVDASSLERSHIHIKKTEILSDLKQRLKHKNITDIR